MKSAGWGWKGPQRRGLARLRIRTLLVLLVLVPTIGLVALAAGSVRSAWEERQAANRLDAGVQSLSEAIDARRAVTDEELYAATISNAVALGVDVDALSGVFEVDLERALADARTASDGAAALQSDARLQADLARLQALRPEIDADGVESEAVQAAFRSLRDDLDAEWDRRVAVLTSSSAFASFSPEAQADLEALERTYLVLTSSTRRIDPARAVLTGDPTPGEVAQLFDASSRLAAASAGLQAELGEEAAAEWRSLQDDPLVQVFEATVDDAVAVAASGAPPPLDGTSDEFVQRFAGAGTLVQHLTDLVRAAAQDLEARSEADARDATRSAVVQSVGATLLVVASLVAAGLIARQVERPARRLWAAAEEVRDGRFAEAHLAASGPRELADAAAAFNEMSATLEAVESQVVLLAEDPGAVEADRPLPGRIGQALHSALQRLRASIHATEDERAELEELAAQDALTGLLNRRAGLDALDGALARARRHGGRTMVLFVDLDDLKQLNDRHGHDAGDAALVVVADALRATTRADDAVARLGGDEFIVAGGVDGPDEVAALAERIRTAVGSSSLVWRGRHLRVHCSIGMAVSGDVATTADDLVHEADLALYEAKHQGRDRAAWAPTRASS